MNRDLIARRQLMTLAFVSMLSPVIRQIPRSMVAEAGAVSWAGALLAIPLIALLALFLRAFLRKREPGEGMADQICKALGPRPGRAAVLIYMLWLLFYGGVVLRAGAERFVATVFPASQLWVFEAVMLALVITAGLSSLRVLARVTELILPLLLTILVLVFTSILPQVRSDNLLPLSRLDAVPVLRAAFPALNTVSLLTYAGFLENHVPPERLGREALRPLLGLAVIILLLCLSTVGFCGPELVSRMNTPFFTMLRELNFLHTMERVEALIIAQWVILDFVLLSCVLHICTENLCILFRKLRRRPLVWPCAGVLLLFSATAAPDSFRLQLLTEKLLPLSHAVLILAGLPLIFLVGRLRGKI